MLPVENASPMDSVAMKCQVKVSLMIYNLMEIQWIMWQLQSEIQTRTCRVPSKGKISDIKNEQDAVRAEVNGEVGQAVNEAVLEGEKSGSYLQYLLKVNTKDWFIWSEKR